MNSLFDCTKQGVLLPNLSYPPCDLFAGNTEQSISIPFLIKISNTQRLLYFSENPGALYSFIFSPVMSSIA
jgi:hypothetical protein